MKTTIRKQFSKNYQVFEITVEDVAKEHMESVLNKMDVIGKAEINKMVEVLGVEDIKPATFTKPTYEKKEYTPKPQYTQRQNNGGGGNYPPKAASPKQLEFLKKYGVEFDPATITAKQASELLESAFAVADSKKAAPSVPSAPSPVADAYQEMSMDLDDLPF